MKSNLFLLIFFNYILISFSALSGLSGGWQKGSFKENDVFIDQAFRKAFEIYKIENPDADIDQTQRLTLYRQMTNGINYKMCFIDLKSNLNVIQEYVISGPAFGDYDSRVNFNLFERHVYQGKNINVESNDKRYPRIQNTLFGFLKGSGENILFINKIEIVETPLDNFYIVNAQGEKKEHIYVVGQSVQHNDEYEGYGILK
jgi:hypothetical protein